MTVGKGVVYTYEETKPDKTKENNGQNKKTHFHAPHSNKSWSLGHCPRAPSSRIHVPLDMFPALAIAPVPPLAPRLSLLCEVGL